MSELQPRKSGSTRPVGIGNRCDRIEHLNTQGSLGFRRVCYLQDSPVLHEQICVSPQVANALADSSKVAAAATPNGHIEALATLLGSSFARFATLRAIGRVPPGARWPSTLRY